MERRLMLKQEHLKWGGMSKRRVGRTVKRLMVCSLCGPATICSDALSHWSVIPPFFFFLKKCNEVILHEESHQRWKRLLICRCGSFEINSTGWQKHQLICFLLFQLDFLHIIQDILSHSFKKRKRNVKPPMDVGTLIKGTTTGDARPGQAAVLIGW